MSGELLTISQVAERLQNVPLSSLYAENRKHGTVAGLPVIHAGGRDYVSARQLEQLLDKGAA